MSSDDDQESRVNVIPMDSFVSDGDMSTWPGHPYAERNDQKWRELLARNWLAKMGSLETGEFTRGSFMPLLFLYIQGFGFSATPLWIFCCKAVFLFVTLSRYKGTKD